MDAHALTIKTVRDGPGRTLVLRGDLDLPATGRFLEQAALAADDRTGRLGFDLARVLFLDCAGVRALRIATRLAPGRCPVITGSLSPMPRRIVELLGLDLANLREPSLSHGRRDGPRDRRTGQQDLVPAEPGAAFLAGTEDCP
jgi:anti-anti-sigma regulatory factor